MMTKGIFLKISTAILIGMSTLHSQNEGDVDAIEKARQAKEAADKAAADAAAATEAAIEAAANKAAKEAREEAKRKKEEEEARKAAEAAAAEEAELDAAAQAAAREAKRKMAAELGLEIEEDESDTTDTLGVSDTSESVEAKEALGFNFGLSGSFGFVNGEYLTNSPVGGSLTITTPVGFKLGPLDFTTSIALGSYGGEVGSRTFDLLVAGIGGNVTLANLLFYEGHVGLVGAGAGGRGFGGVSLERLFSNNLNLPVNILIGGEGFIALTPEDGAEDATYWGGLGVRLDYSF